MELFFKAKFFREYRNIRNKEVIAQIIRIFQQIERADSISDISGLKKLREYVHFYRIRIKLSFRNDYRLVLMIKHNKVWAESIAHVSRIFYKRR